MGLGPARSLRQPVRPAAGAEGRADLGRADGPGGETPAGDTVRGSAPTALPPPRPAHLGPAARPGLARMPATTRDRSGASRGQGSPVRERAGQCRPAPGLAGQGRGTQASHPAKRSARSSRYTRPRRGGPARREGNAPRGPALPAGRERQDQGRAGHLLRCSGLTTHGARAAPALAPPVRTARRGPARTRAPKSAAWVSILTGSRRCMAGVVIGHACPVSHRRSA